jgi:hypothetical protein
MPVLSHIRGSILFLLAPAVGQGLEHFSLSMIQLRDYCLQREIAKPRSAYSAASIPPCHASTTGPRHDLERVCDSVQDGASSLRFSSLITQQQACYVETCLLQFRLSLSGAAFLFPIGPSPLVLWAIRSRLVPTLPGGGVGGGSLVTASFDGLPDGCFEYVP